MTIPTKRIDAYSFAQGSSRIAHVLTRIQTLHLVVLSSCSYKYQQCTSVMMDEFGEGQPVQHLLFETNRDWHMERAIDHLKRAHPGRSTLLEVIIVDKDTNEIKVVQA